MKKKVIKIANEDNNFQKFETLKNNRNKRHKEKEFIFEGVRNINQALKNNWTVKYLLYSGEKKLSDWARNIIETTKSESVFELPQLLMDKLSEKDDTSELIVVAQAKEDNLDNIILKKIPLIAVFDRPSNRGNLGTIIRSCDALGCDGLIITGHSVDMYDPYTIASTTGSFFKLPIVRKKSTKDILNYVNKLKLKFTDIQIIGTDENGEKTIDMIDYNKPTVLLIGNETDGLSKNYKELCSELVKIPIGGSASSLNVACATSIFLYEVNRQRQFEMNN